jgi:hypothetical protein
MGVLKSFAIVVRISPTDRESIALIFPNDSHKRQVQSKLKPHIPIQNMPTWTQKSPL